MTCRHSLVSKQGPEQPPGLPSAQSVGPPLSVRPRAGACCFVCVRARDPVLGLRLWLVLRRSSCTVCPTPPPLRKRTASPENEGQTGSPCVDKPALAQVRVWGAIKERIQSSHMPPCHRHMVFATNSIQCLTCCFAVPLKRGPNVALSSPQSAVIECFLTRLDRPTYLRPPLGRLGRHPRVAKSDDSTAGQPGPGLEPRVLWRVCAVHFRFAACASACVWGGGGGYFHEPCALSSI